MRAINPAELLPLAPAGVLLFILPFPHTVALRLLCLFASFVLALVLWRRLEPPPLPLKVPILLWVLVVLLSLVSAVDFRYSLREVQNELGYTMIAFVSLFALARDERALRLLGLSVALGFLAISLLALGGYAWLGAWRGNAFYGGFGAISNYLVTAAPGVALAIWLWRPANAARWLAAAMVLYLVVAAIALQRSIWPALAAQALVGFAWLWRTGKYSWGVHRSAAALLVLAVLLTGLSATELLRTRADPQPGASMFKDLRPRFWLAVAGKIAEHPLVGAGFGQRALVKAYPELVPHENTLLWHAHNLVLNYGIYAGIPGIVAVLTLFVALFLRFWRISLAGDDPARRFAGLAGAAMVAGVFVRNIFNDFFIRDGAILFWALAGMLLGYALRRSR